MGGRRWRLVEMQVGVLAVPLGAVRSAQANEVLGAQVIVMGVDAA